MKHLTKPVMGATQCNNSRRVTMAWMGGPRYSFCMLHSEGWLMRRRSVLLVFLAIAVFFGCANSAFAQVGAHLSGTVTDPSAGAIAGATINLRNPATDTTYNATANDQGYYALANLPPGTYALKVS